MTPTIATLTIQRIASFAIKIKMNSKTTPAIMKMVVKVMINRIRGLLNKLWIASFLVLYSDVG